MGIDELLTIAESLFSGLSVYLNKIVIALVIVLFGFIIGKIVELILRKVLISVNADERLTKLFGAKRNYSRAIRRTIVRIIYIGTIVISLRSIGWLDPVLMVLVVMTLVILFLSFILAGIDIVPNIAARVSLRSKRIVVGDEVMLSDKSGTIQGSIVDMTLTDVHIKRKNGDLFFIPNAVFLRENITKRRRN